MHMWDIQPRIGVAYAFNEKTVLRSRPGPFLHPPRRERFGLPGRQPALPAHRLGLQRLGGLTPAAERPTAFPLTVTSQDPVFPNPQAWAWNVTLERQLGKETVVAVAYVGRRGLHGQRERNINQLLPGTLQANPGVNPDFLRPYKGFGVIRADQ